MGDLFEISSSKKIFHSQEVKINDTQKHYSYPYVVRSTINNGIRGYIEESDEYLNPKNTLTFAQDTFITFYQDQPYFTGNKVKVLL